MTSWEWMVERIRWTAPWTVVITAVVILVIVAAWASWRLSRWWVRRHIKDELGEIAQAEIEKRDVSIFDLRCQIAERDRRIDLLTVAVRGAHGALSGVIYAQDPAAVRAHARWPQPAARAR